MRRALHYVLKIGNLRKNVDFFRDKLGMTVLRHEVFDQGCEAACNGPYSGKWSKTMIGYGPEDNHFVLELTYNYSIGSYTLGNDLQYIKLALNKDLFSKIKSSEKLDSSENNNDFILISPDGYKFVISTTANDNVVVDPKMLKQQDVTEVCLSCKNLNESTLYWVALLKMNRHSFNDDKDSDCNEEREILLSYADGQTKLRLKQIGLEVDHKSAYGRIAFSCPAEQLKSIQKASEESNQKVLTPFLSLDTPGKATVQVVILADPDGHEICFVGDEGFRELSQVDPKANELIETSIAEDKSDDWFNSKKKSKAQA